MKIVTKREKWFSENNETKNDKTKSKKSITKRTMTMGFHRAKKLSCTRSCVELWTVLFCEQLCHFSTHSRRNGLKQMTKCCKKLTDHEKLSFQTLKQKNIWLKKTISNIQVFEMGY